ncbi:MAG: threonine/serine dehydratase [Armatimonadota bacterium]|nr:threonine/serine dehydratase [Armatimonadota bacterium]MDR5696625.1 threonine/serine dehydratase [Armatimonadota bacterium]
MVYTLNRNAMHTPTLQDVLDAERRIAPYVLRTPLAQMWSAGIRAKLESLQVTGSFKPRGAFHHLLRRLQVCRNGVITASSGNHGQAVAYAARELGLKATVVVPEDVVAVKAEAIERLGAELIRHGLTTADRMAFALQLAHERGLHYAPPYDDADVITGQGTIGLEVLNEFPEVQVVYVPCGGGGLISGVSLAIKTLRPDVRVVGVEPEGAACFCASWKAGRRVRLDRVHSIADGLRAVEPGELTWACASRYVDEFVTVSEEDIRAAMRRLLTEVKVLAEPSGAVAPAAAFAAPDPRRAVAIVSGGNIDPTLLRDIAGP